MNMLVGNNSQQLYLLATIIRAITSSMNEMSVTVLYILVNSYSFSCSLVFSSGNLLLSSYSSYNFTPNLLFSSCNSLTTICSFSTGNNVFMRTLSNPVGMSSLPSLDSTSTLHQHRIS